MRTLETTHEGSLGFRVWRQSLPEQMALPHTHADIELNYITRGGVHYVAGGRIWRIEEQTLSLFWGGIPHQIIQADEGCKGIWITFPFAWFARWCGQDTVFRSVMAGELIQPGENEPTYYADTDRARMETWIEDFTTPGTEHRNILLLEVETRVRRLLASPGASPRTGRARWSGQLQTFQTIAEWIGRSYQNDIGAADVAEATGYHVKYIMGLFKRVSGITVWGFVRQLRLAHAQRLLLTTDASVATIAADSGFRTPRSLYAAFRHYSGGTPAEFRKQTGSKFSGLQQEVH